MGFLIFYLLYSLIQIMGANNNYPVMDRLISLLVIMMRNIYSHLYQIIIAYLSSSNSKMDSLSYLIYSIVKIHSQMLANPLAKFSLYKVIIKYKIYFSAQLNFNMNLLNFQLHYKIL